MYRIGVAINIFYYSKFSQMKVTDNKLFRVEPKSGRLAPGQSTDVTFIYHHEMAGTDRLPVLFKLAQGREILVREFYCIHEFLVVIQFY